MCKATFIRDLPDFRGHASLYRLDPPMTLTDWDEDGSDVTREISHVVVSAADVPFSGPETYIFRSDENGEIISWAELDGSFRGGLDHDEALSMAGYEVKR